MKTKKARKTKRLKRAKHTRLIAVPVEQMPAQESDGMLDVAKTIGRGALAATEDVVGFAAKAATAPAALIVEGFCNASENAQRS